MAATEKECALLIHSQYQKYMTLVVAPKNGRFLSAWHPRWPSNIDQTITCIFSNVVECLQPWPLLGGANTKSASSTDHVHVQSQTQRHGAVHAHHPDLLYHLVLVPKDSTDSPVQAVGVENLGSLSFGSSLISHVSDSLENIHACIQHVVGANNQSRSILPCNTVDQARPILLFDCLSQESVGLSPMMFQKRVRLGIVCCNRLVEKKPLFM
jgi:hypothetical protein